MSSKQKDQVIHDINSSLSALLNALEIVQEEWKTNPDLTDKILPLTFDKLNQLQLHLLDYKKIQ